MELMGDEGRHGLTEGAVLVENPVPSPTRPRAVAFVERRWRDLVGLRDVANWLIVGRVRLGEYVT